MISAGLRGRVDGPRNHEEFRQEAALMTRGKRIPGDDLTDMLNNIHEGADIVESDSPYSSDQVSAERQRAEDDHELEQIIRAQFHQPPAPTYEIPVEILDVLKSPERQELIEVASLLRRSAEHTRTMLFLTPLGDIKCTVNWMSCKPHEINPDVLFFVKTRSNSLAFVPKPGAMFDIAFEGVKGQASVVCLCAPQRFYPSVDLLCFMPHTPFMEKTGQLKEGAPSVVSGRASTGVDADGEPIADGEEPLSKSAFTRASSRFTTPPRDFDQTRPE